ncbi:class I SAM-dependent methyltransferase [Rufibacter glacialis]|uniref:Class I SAM-dependent methyltransferase n=1 Tax=Rufibacter glacialis TaxID=1259555 RepID=A0A5M8Q945_9BACT|nr:class I SAM-dependent methyltransferase [Rufibacter glacialis]KAA6432399.1 class I SAM-dependent methyltransferase [Rufibacter glacialis]GGK78353.1 hypothetical protein GCM10011405_27740 [Rufibacter glacialis]
MNIAEFVSTVKRIDTVYEFERFIDSKIVSVRLYYYGLKKVDLLASAHEFEDSFYELKDCALFKEVLLSREPYSEQIINLLVFFATIFERINPNPIFDIVSNLPDSSIKFRLLAHMLAYEEIDNAKTHFRMNFLRILDLLAKSQFDGEEDYTHAVVVFLVKMYQRAVVKLAGYHFYDEITHLQSLYINEDNKNKYPFLLHPLIENVISGNLETLDDLVVDSNKSKLYVPSDRMLGIFDLEIVKPIINHVDTEGYQMPLGYPSRVVREQILEFGKADFTIGFRNLTDDDKVLLYCYFNMRKHFFTTFFVLERIYDSLLSLFTNANLVPIFIDIGCGPLTSGLAISDLHYQKSGELLKTNYIGIDISPAMLRKAHGFWNRGIFAKESRASFFCSWNQISDDLLADYVGLQNPIIINASYLFASKSLDEIQLARFIKGVARRHEQSKLYFVFQNPNSLEKNNKYLSFKSQFEFITYLSNVEQIDYKTNPYSRNDVSGEVVFFEILELKN